MQVVLAASGAEVDPAAAELAAAGAAMVDAAHLGRQRWLVHGTFDDDTVAEQVAARLRRRHWVAVTRPDGGGHLTAWRRHIEPVVVDEGLWVCVPWSDFDREAVAKVVEIDPGLAFGTGSHPSTRLLLAALAARLRGGERVLDVGCGSGVLGIVAAVCGAGRVTCVDIAPVAVTMTARNAARNGVADRVDASAVAVADLRGPFDVVVANIGAGPLMALAPDLRSKVATGGWIGLSGISPAQISTTAAAYRPLTVTATPRDDDWAAVIITSRG